MNSLTLILALILTSILIIFLKPVYIALTHKQPIGLSRALTYFELSSPFYNAKHLENLFRAKMLFLNSKAVRNLNEEKMAQEYYKYLKAYVPTTELYEYLLSTSTSSNAIGTFLVSYINDYLRKLYTQHKLGRVAYLYTTWDYRKFYAHQYRKIGEIKDEDQKIQLKKLFKLIESFDPRISQSETLKDVHFKFDNSDDISNKESITMTPTNAESKSKSKTTEEDNGSLENDSLDSVNDESSVNSILENESTANSTGEESNLNSTVEEEDEDVVVEDKVLRTRTRTQPKLMPKSSNLSYCDLCETSLSTPSSLERHQLTNKHIKNLKLQTHKSKTFVPEHSTFLTCSQCKEVLNNRSELIKHIKDLHK